MQPGTPPRKCFRCVNNHDDLAIPWAVPTVDSYYSKQFDGQLSFSASDAGSHRPWWGLASLHPCRFLALDHG
ncbi:uncharacterized protein PO1_contig-086-2 [Mycobacterium sp. PO1]|nr:uncharacterized protein PO1_contig-086-2 [Mycobacterium sp. PO1]GFM24783.1 uncharacterized protein PO2_contig-048-2 [Mycobacterium sp. PO2]